MLSLSKVLFCAPYLVPILASARYPPQQGPFALTLNPTSIIASRVNSSGLVELRTYPAALEYKSYYDDTVRHFTQHAKFDTWNCSEAAVSTFRTAITEVTKDLTEVLGHRPKYSALVCPAIFNLSSWCAARRAISTPTEDKDRPFKRGYGAGAACKAYDLFHRPDLLGRAPEDCNDDGPLNLIIGIEYEQSYMHVRLFEMVYEWEGYPRVGGEFCRECGLRFEKTQGAPSYEDRVRVFLDSSIREIVAKNDYFSMDDIRAVVVVGEVPRAAIAKLEDLLRRTLKLDHIRMLNDIDAALVKSYGAASFALHTQTNPEVYKVFVSPYGGLEEHSEL